MIGADKLFDVLNEHSDIDKTLLQFMFNELPKDATLGDFREELIDAGLISYHQLMRLSFIHLMLPRSKALLAKLAEHRKNRTVFAAPTHEQKYFLDEESKLGTSVLLGDTGLELPVPEPDLTDFNFLHSDEKQAVMLAVEIANLGELNEAELILLETRDSFPASAASLQTLCWIYLATENYKQVEIWANDLLDDHPGNLFCLRVLALAEQLSNKHLMATSHLQQMLQREEIDPLWYFLLAYSQQKTSCTADAIDNYQIYLKIGRNKNIRQFAEQQVDELSA